MKREQLLKVFSCPSYLFLSLLLLPFVMVADEKRF